MEPNGTRTRRNWTEPEPSELDLGEDTGTKKLDSGLEETNKHFEDSFMDVVFREEFDGANEKSRNGFC